MTRKNRDEMADIKGRMQVLRMLQQLQRRYARITPLLSEQGLRTEDILEVWVYIEERRLRAALAASHKSESEWLQQELERMKNADQHTAAAASQDNAASRRTESF